MRVVADLTRCQSPVTHQADGSRVASTHDETVALLRAARVSSDPRSHPELPGSTGEQDLGKVTLT